MYGAKSKMSKLIIRSSKSNVKIERKISKVKCQKTNLKIKLKESQK